jgi:hypothetical protein
VKMAIHKAALDSQKVSAERQSNASLFHLPSSIRSPSFPRGFRSFGHFGLFDVTWITWAFLTDAHNVGAHPLIRSDSKQVSVNREPSEASIQNQLGEGSFQ